MSPYTDHEDTDCRQCSLQSVQYAYGDVEKHKLFHEPCRDCNGTATSSTLVTLCDRCQHLRLPHLLLCCIQPGDDQGLYIRFELSSADLKKCALCQFIASFIPPDEDVEIRINGSDGRCFLETRDRSIIIFAEKSGQSRRRVTEYVQWAWLRHAMEEQSGKAHAEEQTLFAGSKELEDVRVIDVSRACVVHLPRNSPYAALSYVWGADSGNQLQASVANIHVLEQPDSLQNADLPRTILDALRVCENLGLQFLWVDRVCILQDNSWANKSVQLNQMAAIYAKAKLTLVAVAGDGADYGLPGVSRPRTVVQKALKLTDFFGLVNGTKNLETCLAESKWYQRGWTYQEHMASSALLFFTNDGIHYQQGYEYKRFTVSEGPAHNAHASRNNDLSSLAMIEVYSRRTLTFATDVLRALAGSLSAVYGERISFGMPWDHFDSAMLWRPYGYKYKDYKYKPRESTGPHVFPSWSWTSIEGKIEFESRGHHVYRLAYWAVPNSKTAPCPTTSRWTAIEVTTRHPKYAGRSGLSRDDLEICTIAALAWLEGCIRTDVPEWLYVDCGHKDYAKRLEKRWPDRESSFWQDASRGYTLNDTFGNVHDEMTNAVGRMLAHTQRASFTLDWDYTQNQNERLDPASTSLLIRTRDHRVAGSVTMDTQWAQQLRLANQQQGDFIVLSISRDWLSYIWNSLIYGHIPKSSDTISPSKFYGCPCSVEGDLDASPAHIVECPRHAEFFSPVPFQPRVLERKDKEPDDLHIKALSKHFADLSYLDANGHLLHDMMGVPQLNVLLIAPSRKASQGGKAYERVGIGKIYLKRWVEASPVFETVVLE